MNNTNYATTIEVAQSPDIVFKSIINVPGWWSKDFEGNSSRQGDEFIIHHTGMHYSKQQLVEVIPDKKIVWLVTDSKLNWIKNNKAEWTNTKMIFELGKKGDKTVLYFTHEGLTTENECYSMCEKGWNIIINDWLFCLVTTGRASEKMAEAAIIRNQIFEQSVASKSYQKTFRTNESDEDEVMKKISQVNCWWKKDFSGSAGKLNDTFTVPFTAPSFVDFIVSELVGNKRLVWKVTDCYLPWFEDKKEWNNTKVVFNLSKENGQTKIDFTHIGLVPEIECFDVCRKGWDEHINTLEKLINEGKGLPD